MDFSSLNFLAILVAAVAAFIVGFLWHGPLFGKQWMKMMNISQAEMEAAKAKGMSAMMPQMIAALVQQIVVATVVSYLAMELGIADAAGAVMLAVLVWVGFIASVLLNTVLWENRKINLYLFNITYHLVTLIVIALVVVLWR